jgi:hypothetical protein
MKYKQLLLFRQQVYDLLNFAKTVWTRLHSPTLQDRTYEHQPSALASKKPISVGQGYSTIAWIPEQEGSWALPLRHERITGWENPIQKAALQIKQVCKYLPQRPIVLLDSEYGNASLADLAAISAPFCCRSLVSLAQATVTLDTAST